MAPHGGMSQAFQDMAAILETLETTKTDVEITSATPIADGILEMETVSLEVCVAVPFLDSSLSDTTTLRPETVALQDDGRLEVELQATAEGQQAAEAIESESKRHTRDGDETASNSNATVTVADDEQQSDRAVSTEPETYSATSTDDTNIADGSHESNGEEADTEDEQLAYRDPDRLRDVYQTYETFAEMTDALNVDVTAQTVRRYMIEYDIHTPASNTGSPTAETLLEADPDSLPDSRADPDRERTDSPKTPGDSRQTKAHVTAPADDAPPSLATEETETPSESQSTASEMLPPNEQASDEHTSREPANHDSDPEVIATDGGKQTTRDDKTRAGDECSSDVTLDEQAIAETVGLPRNLTLDEVKRTVQDAKTLYEVNRQLELDHDDARTLLQQLNLLDLVHGRLATRAHQDRTIAEIDNRIRAVTL